MDQVSISTQTAKRSKQHFCKNKDYLRFYCHHKFQFHLFALPQSMSEWEILTKQSLFLFQAALALFYVCELLELALENDNKVMKANAFSKSE